MSKDLSEFIVNNRKFLKLSDGESIKAVYRGCRIGPNRWDTEKEMISYRLWMEGMDLNKVITWDCARVDVAEDMKKIKEGTEITITRTGSGTNDTKYDIQVAGAVPTPNGNGKGGFVTREQQETIVSLCRQKGLSEDSLKTYLKSINVLKRSEIPATAYNSVVEWIMKSEYPKKTAVSKVKDLVEVEDEVDF